MTHENHLNNADDGKRWRSRLLGLPERNEPGPALLLVDQNTDVTDYIKIEALKFANLGYTTRVGVGYCTAVAGNPLCRRHIPCARICRLLPDGARSAND